MSDSPADKRRRCGSPDHVPEAAPAATDQSQIPSHEDLCAIVAGLQNQMNRRVKRERELESKCRILETALENARNEFKSELEKMQAKHEKDMREVFLYQQHLLSNVNWEYSVPDIPVSYWVDNMENPERVQELLDQLKDATLRMRRGEKDHGMIGLEWRHVEIASYYKKLKPHWKQFAAALAQYREPPICIKEYKGTNTFRLDGVNLEHKIIDIIEEAIHDKTLEFRHIDFIRNDLCRRGAAFLIGLIKHHLPCLESVKLASNYDVYENAIPSLKDLCHAIQNHRGVTSFSLTDHFYADNFDDARMVLEICTGLTHISLENNGLPLQGSPFLSEYLSRNTRLQSLNLERNCLVDSDVQGIITGLRANSNLRYLNLQGNQFTDIGRTELRRLVYNDSSIHSVVESQHTCQILIEFCFDAGDSNCDDLNADDDPVMNKNYKVFLFLLKKFSRGRGREILEENDLTLALFPQLIQCICCLGARDRDLGIVHKIFQEWALPLL